LRLNIFGENHINMAYVQSKLYNGLHKYVDKLYYVNQNNLEIVLIVDKI